jgi:tRNA G10  N-methylase Trm11
MSASPKRYVIQTIKEGAKELGLFGVNELRAVASMHGEDDLFSNETEAACADYPFVYPVTLKDEKNAAAIVERAQLTRGMYEVIGTGDSMETCIADVKAQPGRWCDYFVCVFYFLILLRVVRMRSNLSLLDHVAS